MQVEFNEAERIFARLCVILSKRLEGMPLNVSEQEYFNTHQYTARPYMRRLLAPEHHYPLADKRFVLPPDHLSLIEPPPPSWLR